ncbi:MAG: hypothetical protein V9E91_09180 [Burkholderiaceae bacterium]
MATIAVLGLASSFAHAQAAAIKPCPLNPADLSKALGVAFADGMAEKNPFGGMSCTYKSKGDAPAFKSNVSVFISQMPMQGTFDNMKMFLGPMSTKYEAGCWRCRPSHDGGASAQRTALSFHRVHAWWSAGEHAHHGRYLRSCYPYQRGAGWEQKIVGTAPRALMV